MKIVKVGSYEYWKIPEGVQYLLHLPCGSSVKWVDELPSDCISIGTKNGIHRYRINHRSRNARYQRTFAKKMRDAGYIEAKIWSQPSDVPGLRKFAENQIEIRSRLKEYIEETLMDGPGKDELTAILEMMS